MHKVGNLGALLRLTQLSTTVVLLIEQVAEIEVKVRRLLWCGTLGMETFPQRRFAIVCREFDSLLQSDIEVRSLVAKVAN